MSDGVKFPYLSRTESKRPTDLMPYLPFQLQRKGKSQDAFGLVDSGASVNVLPYQIGLNLGAVWGRTNSFVRFKRKSCQL